MPSAQNESEAYVASLSQRSFLSLWSYPNPVGKKGKELCDLLVVCGENIAIISIKDIRLSDHPDERVRVERWAKKALDGSFKQIAGAERWLSEQDAVTDVEGARGVALPPADARRVYRVALAFGGQGQAVLPQGNQGDGFAHSMDEGAFDVLIRELDTATDFFDYLRRKERFLSTSQVLFEGREEDLLAAYLMNNRSFPDEATLVVLGEGIWEAFEQSAEYAARAQANAISVVWDSVIEEHIEGLRSGPRPPAPAFVESAQTPLEAEKSLRVMAQEDRYWRRVLSEQLAEFVRGTSVRARAAISPERLVTYVLPPGAGRRGRRRPHSGVAAQVLRGPEPVLGSPGRDRDGRGLSARRPDGAADAGQARVVRRRRSKGRAYPEGVGLLRCSRRASGLNQAASSPSWVNKTTHSPTAVGCEPLPSCLHMAGPSKAPLDANAAVSSAAARDSAAGTGSAGRRSRRRGPCRCLLRRRSPTAERVPKQVHER